MNYHESKSPFASILATLIRRPICYTGSRFPATATPPPPPRFIRVSGPDRPQLHRSKSPATSTRKKFGVRCLALMLFFTSTGAVALELGDGADAAAPADESFSNVADYLADANRGNYRNVEIDGVLYPRFELDAFHTDNLPGGLTDANLIAEYADVSAYQADTSRDTLYARVNGEVYRVSVLDAADNAGSLTDFNLANDTIRSLELGDRTTALGDNARATANSATAVGASASATAIQNTALGHYAGAFGSRSTAVGQHVRVYGSRSVAVGRFTQANGERATVVGAGSVGYGDRTTVVGAGANAIGDRSAVFGQGAAVINLAPGEFLSDVVPEADGLGGLVECAHDPAYDDDSQSYINDCTSFLTASENADPLLGADTPAGAAFRATTRARLQGRLAALEVENATAVGTFAFASKDNTTALGANSAASGENNTALGANSVASGDESQLPPGDDLLPGEGSTAVGANSEASGAGSTALGATSEATGHGSLALGLASSASGANSTAIGLDSVASGDDSIAIGDESNASAEGSIAIGDESNASGRGGVAIGEESDASGLDSLALATGSNASGEESIAIGFDSTASGSDGIAIGDESTASGSDGIAIGELSVASNENSIAIGEESASTGANSVALGGSSYAPGDDSIAIGEDSTARGLRSITIGTDSSASGIDSVALGGSSAAGGEGSAAFGAEATAVGERSIAFGSGANAGGALATDGNYISVSDYRTDNPSGSNTGHVVIAGRLYSSAAVDAWIGGLPDFASLTDYQAATIPNGTTHVVIDGRVYALEDLNAIPNLTDNNLDEVVVVELPPESTLAPTTENAVAVGAGSNAEGANAIALGSGAQANFDNAIAIGADVTAGANQVVIGTANHTYTLPGLATAPGVSGAVVSVDENGQITNDGGALDGRVTAAQNAATDAQNRVGAVETSLGALDGRVSTAQSAATDAQDRVDVVETSLGASSDSASETGSAFARAAAAQAAADNAQREVDVLEGVVDALGSTSNTAVDAEARTNAAAAQSAAEDAQDAAEDAQDAAETAQSTADGAQTAAEGAQAAAVAAQSTADGAQTAAETAQSTADGAQTAAEGAQSAAEGAQAAAVAAQSTADGAQTAAETAQSTADGAQTAAETAQSAAETAQSGVDDLNTRVGAADDAPSASPTGSVFARIGAIDSALTAAAGSAEGAAAAALVNSQRAEELAERAEEAVEIAQSASSALEAFDAQGEFDETSDDGQAVQDIYEEVTTGMTDSGETQERVLTTTTTVGGEAVPIIVLTGEVNEQIQTLIALLSDRGGAPTLPNGQQANTTLEEFDNLDVPSVGGPALNAHERARYLFRALYGNPVRDYTADPDNLNTYAPDPESVVGRHQKGTLRSELDVRRIAGGEISVIGSDSGETVRALTDSERDTLRAATSGYEAAPDIGSGGAAPTTAEGRRVVVQDVNEDGTIRLTTLPLDGALSGMDRRVDVLGTRVDQVAAASAALTALPNLVPGGKRYYLGLGLGNYRSESALAVGLSARKDNFHFNLGASSALSSDSSTSSRIGVGWVW